jgi:hypothetical protein
MRLLWDLVAFCGAACVVAGVWLIYVPAALVLAGVWVVWLAVDAERRSRR